jgi:hypothetical protein
MWVVVVVALSRLHMVVAVAVAVPAARSMPDKPTRSLPAAAAVVGIHGGVAAGGARRSQGLAHKVADSEPVAIPAVPVVPFMRVTLLAARALATVPVVARVRLPVEAGAGVTFSVAAEHQLGMV